MPIDVKTLELGDGSSFSRTDRVMVWRLAGVSNASGGSGAAVTTAVTVPGVSLPADYSAFVDTKGQNCWAEITSKTAAGFNVALQPPAGISLSAGSFDVVIIG